MCAERAIKDDKKAEDDKKGYQPGDDLPDDELRKIPEKYNKKEAPEKKEAKSIPISEPVKKSWEKPGMREDPEEKKEEKKVEKKEEKKDEKKDDKKDKKEEEKKEDEDGVGGDSFMREMTKLFAVEGGKEKEVPNGEFWFDRKGAKSASIQTLIDYKHLPKSEAEAWACDNFEEAWDYMDPGNTGKIEADRMPRFLTYLAH